MSDLPVYGWNEDGWHRVIVAAKSRAGAHRAYTAAVGYVVPIGRLADYGDWTGNAEEIRAANLLPGTPFRSMPRTMNGPWTPILKVTP